MKPQGWRGRGRIVRGLEGQRSLVKSVSSRISETLSQRNSIRQFIFVYVCSCVYECTGTCVYMYMDRGIPECGSQRSNWVIHAMPSTLFFETRLVIGLSSPSRLDWLSSKPQGTCLSTPPRHWDCKLATAHVAFSQAFRDRTRTVISV